MATRPRVTAKAQRDPVTDSRLCDRFTSTTPGVLIEASFDLHDHESALTALEGAAAEIRAQIEEVR